MSRKSNGLKGQGMPAGIDEAYYGFLGDAPIWAPTDFALFAGDTVQGSAYAPEDGDSYFLFLSPELTYTITATSSFGPPPRFSVDNTGLFPVAFSQVDGNTSTVTFTGNSALAARYFTITGTAGTIYIATLSVSGVTETSGTGETISAGAASYEGSLDFLSDVDHFTLNVLAGHTYQLALDTAIDDLAVRVSMFQASGTVHVPLVEVEDGIFEFTPNVDGAFDVSVRSETYRGEGDYSFGITDATTAGNVAPVAEDLVQNLLVMNNAPRAVVLNAQDADGDAISYSFTDPEHGSVSQDAENRFIYKADVDYVGTDAFRITLSDGEGGTSVQDVNLFIVDAVANESWRLLAAQDFSSEIQGAGSVFGTSREDDVTVLFGNGIITFDPSFNGGGDAIRLTGNIADWDIVQVGSTAQLTNGFQVMVIPVGIAGITLGFDDASSTLQYDRLEDSVMIGNQQVFTWQESLTTDAIDGPQLPDPAVTESTGRLLFNRNGTATLGGKFDVFGNNVNGITITHGEITLDPSFSGGYDGITLNGEADDYTVRLFGSSAIFESDTTTLTVPVSPDETFLQVGIDGGGLYLDASAGKVFIGSQEITAMEMPLTFA